MAEMQKIGAYAFIAGVILAIIIGIFSSSVAAYAGIIGLILVILGLIVGFANIKDKETTAFLIAAIALMLVGAANLSSLDTVLNGLGTALAGIVLAIQFFVAPAALIIALKSIWSMAKE
ncbi:MAG: hypothetical protein V1494_04080 [Candidatus Diapherotrites archaeon]